MVFSKHWNVCCRICPVQHGNSGITNSVSLGRGYVFIRPIADREESSENLFEKKKVFDMEMTLLLKVLSRRDISISALKCLAAPHTSVKFLCFTHKWDIMLANPAFYKVSERKAQTWVDACLCPDIDLIFKKVPTGVQGKGSKAEYGQIFNWRWCGGWRGKRGGMLRLCGWGDGIKAHQLHDLIKEDQRLEWELHADSKVGEGLSDWDCKICQRHNHKAKKKNRAEAEMFCMVL